eukprot:TRINITY_DN67405_c8_g2_i4.p1 TRINITY_DN67405_c8_g2~~TRINITY_DN67405_c8_g2_i4.p1  ORF type:complete len:136 (-),score=9.76 TRINITY_DN67405_c8_g2_i4:603-1010(-)
MTSITPLPTSSLRYKHKVSIQTKRGGEESVATASPGQYPHPSPQGKAPRAQVQKKTQTKNLCSPDSTVLYLTRVVKGLMAASRGPPTCKPARLWPKKKKADLRLTCVITKHRKLPSKFAVHRKRTGLRLVFYFST